jgi:hypothetical protein
MKKRGLLAVLFASMLGAACGAQVPGPAAPAANRAAQPTATAVATPTAPATPISTPTPPPTPAPAPPTAPPADVPHTFALGGSGSVSVAPMGATARITVTISGLAAVAHAVHLHMGCTGANSAHLFAIGTVGSAGTIGITVPARDLGATVIVYPDASATGKPILCGATA